MRSVSLVTVGAVSALIGVAGFVVGIVLMASSGVELLIPETGSDGLAWSIDVVDAGDQFVAGAAIVVFAGVLLLVAFVGFYDALREAGPLLILAPIAGAAGVVLVTISHATPIALALELAPAYSAADPAAQASLIVGFDTVAQFCLLLNYFGDILVWGVTVPLFAFAILTTWSARRWIGWVGVASAVLGGWLGLLSPLSSLVEGVSSIGFLIFFVFMASLGIALLRPRPEPIEAPAVVA